ncbi:hypothetical protein [Actinoplanes sp. DH11]|uniref:hypothetical protein n=1 Tax=Actinoplanes sp. DH11 TaxID=2857011 RepID=UPI001E298606|nr:hypothetical protein [Actinoplanes sp. DH11]
MIKPAWYAITESHHPRQLPIPGLAAQLHELFGHGAAIDPARTGAAVEVALQMVEYLTDAVPHGPAALACRDDIATLLHGLNLLLAGLTQISGRLAQQVHAGTTADLTRASVPDRQRASAALATATARLLEAAGRVKEAHLDIATR